MKKILRILKYIIIVFFASTIFFTILYRYINPPLTPLMLIRIGEQIAKGEKIKLKKKWVKLDDISQYMKKAVITAEDNKFAIHYGFDIEAIEKAYKYNQKKKKIKGGSTISQQTAKNVFLWQDRTWVRKGFEVYFTLLIEILWSKERILEVYLNVIEMGDGIYGIQRAAETYFHKPASALNKPESALIASSLPNPRKFNPSKPSPFLNKRKNLILRLMNKTGKVEF